MALRLWAARSFLFCFGTLCACVEEEDVVDGFGVGRVEMVLYHQGTL